MELLEELGACFVIYDRPGYGESDPSSRRGPESEAEDVEELADQLQLGSRFHVIGISMGAYVAWGCLMYIPQRLSGVTLISTFYNYNWSGFPLELMNKYFKKKPRRAQWIARIAYYAPWLLYWFMTQKCFPFGNANEFTKEDEELFKKIHMSPKIAPILEKTTKQGVYYSLYQDMLAAYGKWERSPLDLKNPFPNNEGEVHFWQGSDDRIGPAEISRFTVQKLPWIKYHELPGKGHMMIHVPDLCELIFRESLSS